MICDFSDLARLGYFYTDCYFSARMVKDGPGVYIEKMELLGRPFQPNGLLVAMAMKVLLFYFFEGLVKNGHVVCG